ncbi:hypothetical protein GALMADRAFT_249794 [Galerina marginata CBS 339.88]|uniref:PNPLA domain-containing protein n=1 Tax=Galerina marginata (strain CBS 339.88) TaxID=685588 RepID=A0A067T7B3_GALM3|nr:hypothetical protein GALMADRAFT_249794 [Galerina marginata CBS 339.88]
MSSSGVEPPLKLLSLDGGGIRGLSELLMIKEVMHRLMFEENSKQRDDGIPPRGVPKPCDYFDLIGGTGTGGIIALMLGRLRMDVDMAIEQYCNLVQEVFSDAKALGGNGKFSATKLEKVIKSVVQAITGDSESPLQEADQGVTCRTFVCALNAHNMDGNIPQLFRTYQSRQVPFDCKIWEAARATSAMPTLFEHIEIGRQQPFIDGGLGRNNPSWVVLYEAKDLFKDRQIGCLVSIGTGKPEVISIQSPRLFPQFIPTKVLEALKAIATGCEDTHQAMLRLLAHLPNTYFRLNVEQGMQGIDVSEWEKSSHVEAHTTQYMKTREVDVRIDQLVNAIRTPTGQITMEQLISPRRSITVKESSTLASIVDKHLADDIRKWLSPPDSSKTRYEADERRQSDTCSWFLEGSRFLEWKAIPGFLWVKGKVGCGKTVLSSSIINRLSEPDRTPFGIANFFFDGRNSQNTQQHHDQLIRSLISQFSHQRGGIPANLAALYKLCGDSQQPSVNQLQDALEGILNEFFDTYIVIDALDECTDLEKTLNWVRNIVLGTPAGRKVEGCHIVVTSRPLEAITKVFTVLDPHSIDVGEAPENRDIMKYLNFQMESKFENCDEETRKKIKSKLEDGADGSFRWVALQLAEDWTRFITESWS